MLSVFCSARSGFVDLFNSGMQPLGYFRFVRMPKPLPFLFAALKISARYRDLAVLLNGGRVRRPGHTMWLA